MINNSAWQTIIASATDISTVVEIYDADATPDATNGFDPGDAIGLYAAIDNLEYFGQTYTQMLTSIGSVKRTITGEINQASVTFDNVGRLISRFEFTNGFEGLIMVIRTISRSLSTTLAKSQILFAGRCEKPDGGDKNELTVKASQILGGSQNVVIPRRKYTPDDQEGRTTDDPEFEGFIYIPQQGTSNYQVQVKRGGIAGFFGKKKWINQTLAWSSYSDLDSTKSLPEVFGTSQLVGTHIAFADTGSVIQIRDAFSEGEVFDVQNIRSLDPALPLDSGPIVSRGLVGALNYDSGGISPANYSRTVVVRCQSSYSTINQNDTAPDIVAVIIGRVLTTPNAGTWNVSAWTNNAAAIARYVITSDNYFKLDAAWVDDTEAYTCWQYNDALIISRSFSDYTFLKQG